MIFHNQREKIEDKIPEIMISNTKIEKVSDLSFLGITLNEHMNWKPR